jgi:hypothetical protein
MASARTIFPLILASDKGNKNTQKNTVKYLGQNTANRNLRLQLREALSCFSPLGHFVATVFFVPNTLLYIPSFSFGVQTIFARKNRMFLASSLAHSLCSLVSSVSIAVITKRDKY